MSDIPAFPVSFKWNNEFSQYNGMSLRDYFASKAMQALIDNDSLFSEIPTQAYELADAMMKARKE
jgi:hypothetical protein